MRPHMRPRTRLICGASLLALALGVPATAAHAVSGTITVTAPATAIAKTDVNVVYSGSGDGSDVGATGAVMFQAYMTKGGTDCAPTVLAQKNRAGTKLESQQYVSAPSPTPFEFTSQMFVDTDGDYRVCAYLSAYPVDENAAPLSTSTVVVKVGEASKPCVVPNVKGMTLKTAQNRMKVAGCKIGRLFGKPKKVPKNRVLVVKTQSVRTDTVIDAGAVVNLSLQLRKKK